MVGLQDDAAAASAVAAAGAAFGDVGFTMERHGAFSAVSGLGVDFDFVDEHYREFQLLILNWSGRSGEG